MHHKPSSINSAHSNHREAELICRKKNAEMVKIDFSCENGLLEEMRQSDESDLMIRGVVLT